MNDAGSNCSLCSVGSCALETLSFPEILSMETNSLKTSFKKGEILRKQDTPLDSIIYLRKGYVKEFIWNNNETEQVIQIVKPRSYIGLQGLCTNISSVFSYQAVTDIDVCFIEKDTFGNLISGNGNFAREILISLSHETLSNHKRFLGLNQKQTYGKVAGLLLYLSEEVYENSEFELHLKRTEMAQMIASTRESVSRALMYFQLEGMIEISRNWIRIIDHKRIDMLATKG